MKYYLIAGEASGDLHASNLMAELKNEDPNAEFRFYGGDKMAAVGGTLVKHYKKLAYMGFIPVLMHLPQIMKGMKECKADIKEWQPDVVILVDYPGFNLGIAKWVHANKKQGGWNPKVFYYISPKIWAWKEHRIKAIRRDVDELFSILPFEVEWFEKRNYPIHYVGNPCVDAVTDYFKDGKNETCEEVEQLKQSTRNGIIAILAGSRKQEIKDNLKTMLIAAHRFEGYKLVIAGAPNIDEKFYQKYIPKEYNNVHIVFDKTYDVLKAAQAAVVTSGTATLETAIIGTPQVVCYYTPLGSVFRHLKENFLAVPYISLVNLIAGREIVKELIADDMNTSAIGTHLLSILPGGVGREKMISNYKKMNDTLGGPGASAKAAKMMVEILRNK